MDSGSINSNEFTEMLEGMTKQELVKYARMTYGLSVTAKLNKHDLVRAIQDAQRKFQGNNSLQTGDSVSINGFRVSVREP